MFPETTEIPIAPPWKVPSRCFPKANGIFPETEAGPCRPRASRWPLHSPSPKTREPCGPRTPPPGRERKKREEGGGIRVSRAHAAPLLTPQTTPPLPQHAFHLPPVHRHHHLQLQTITEAPAEEGKEEGDLLSWEMQPPPSQEMLSSTLSFRRIPDEERPESGRTASLAGFPEEIPAVDPLLGLDKAVNPVEGKNGEEEEEEEFEFAVLSRDSFEGIEPITAEEIFYNGQIRPLYPLFNRALLLDDAGFQHQEQLGEQSDATAEARKPARVALRKLMMEEGNPPSTSSSSVASSESDELEGIPADSYCLWTPGSLPPSPDMRRRSHSTGDSSSSKRWRLRDLVIGRSHSDGRKKFLFLASPSHAPSTEAASKKSLNDKGGSANTAAAEEEKKKGKGRGRVKVLEMDMVTAHRLYYGKGGAATGDRRRSFLPYRKDLMGLFANVNGAGRGPQPF